MKVFSVRNIVIFVAIILIIVAGVFYVNNSDSKAVAVKKDEPKSANNASHNFEVDKYEYFDSKALNISDSEFVLGDKNATVTFIDYASMSCPHCAAFYDEAFGKLREEYIDTGKVKFVYRDFPLNHPSLAAASLAICRASEFDSEERVEGYHDFVETMYNTQNSWIFKEDYNEKLISIAVLEGMDKTLAKKCLSDTKFHDQILKARMIAAKELDIQSTPTFFINGKKIQGFIGYKKIKELIDYELNK